MHPSPVCPSFQTVPLPCLPKMKNIQKKKVKKRGIKNGNRV
jgi:hypothetical protein